MQKSKVLLAEVTDHWLHSPFSSRASCLSLGHRPVHALKWPDVKQTSWREAGRGGGRGPLSSYLLSPLASEQPPHPPILSFFGAPHPPHLLQDILGPPRTKPRPLLSSWTRLPRLPLRHLPTRCPPRLPDGACVCRAPSVLDSREVRAGDSPLCFEIIKTSQPTDEIPSGHLLPRALAPFPAILPPVFLE